VNRASVKRFVSLQFLNPRTVDKTPWTEDQSVARPVPTQRKTQTQNRHTQTSMPRVGFETTIPAFERVKTVHALDRAATVIGWCRLNDDIVMNLTEIGSMNVN
jgi:hypothetical protein